MALKVERRDGSAERQVIIGMICHRAVLGPIAARWESGGMFPSRVGSLIGGWCVEHYRRYRRAPGPDIAGYLDAWAETARDRDTVVAVEGLLAGLSDEFERLKRTAPSPDYVLDQAARLFNRHRLADLRARIEADLEAHDEDRAEERVQKFRKVELGLGAGILPLQDEEAIISAVEERLEAVIEYPGALGNFFGPALGRDQFVAFQAPEKRGKSFWLLDVAWRAAEQGRNVVYFEVGDNSQHQVLRRLCARVAARPLGADVPYEWPESLDPPNTKADLPDVRHAWQNSGAELSAADAVATLRAHAAGDPTRFRLSCHPNSSVSVAGLETILEAWQQDGWVPDAVVVDYADILAPLDGRAETRDQINATWKALRSLSQRWHCLVVTATQSDADSYTAHTMARDNFSEDKRKYAHVTGMVGINQIEKEREKGLFRLNWVCLRELEYSEKKCVWTASCLAASAPAVLSTF